MCVKRFTSPTPPDPHATNWRTGHKLTYDIDHADELFFLDPHGHERFVMSSPGHVEAGSLPAPMRSYLDTTGRRNLTHPGGGTWTVSQALQALAWLTGQPIPIASADRSG